MAFVEPKYAPSSKPENSKAERPAVSVSTGQNVRRPQIRNLGISKLLRSLKTKLSFRKKTRPPQLRDSGGAGIFSPTERETLPEPLKEQLDDARGRTNPIPTDTASIRSDSRDSITSPTPNRISWAESEITSIDNLISPTASDDGSLAGSTLNSPRSPVGNRLSKTPLRSRLSYSESLCGSPGEEVSSRSSEKKIIYSVHKYVPNSPSDTISMPPIRETKVLFQHPAAQVIPPRPGTSDSDSNASTTSTRTTASSSSSDAPLEEPRVVLNGGVYDLKYPMSRTPFRPSKIWGNGRDGVSEPYPDFKNRLDGLPSPKTPQFKPPPFSKIPRLPSLKPGESLGDFRAKVEAHNPPPLSRLPQKDLQPMRSSMVPSKYTATPQLPPLQTKLATPVFAGIEKPLPKLPSEISSAYDLPRTHAEIEEQRRKTLQQLERSATPLEAPTSQPHPTSLLPGPKTKDSSGVETLRPTTFDLSEQTKGDIWGPRTFDNNNLMSKYVWAPAADPQPTTVIEAALIPHPPTPSPPLRPTPAEHKAFYHRIESGIIEEPPMSGPAPMCPLPSLPPGTTPDPSVQKTLHTTKPLPAPPASPTKDDTSLCERYFSAMQTSFGRLTTTPFPPPEPAAIADPIPSPPPIPAPRPRRERERLSGEEILAARDRNPALVLDAEGERRAAAALEAEVRARDKERARKRKEDVKAGVPEKEIQRRERREEEERLVARGERLRKLREAERRSRGVW